MKILMKIKIVIKIMMMVIVSSWFLEYMIPPPPPAPWPKNTHVMVLARVMVLVRVMVLACDGWGAGHTASAPEGQSQAGPKGPKPARRCRQLEVGALDF